MSVKRKVTVPLGKFEFMAAPYRFRSPRTKTHVPAARNTMNSTPITARLNAGLASTTCAYSGRPA